MAATKTRASGKANTPELDALEAKLLEQKIRFERAKADITEIELAERVDQERDRKAKGGYNRRLSITGVIDNRDVDVWIGALEHWASRDPGEPIEIVIDSPGGDVLAGLALFDQILRLRRQGHHITTRGRGMIASMATIIMQAGDERVLDANAQFMIHEISYGARGKSSEIADMVAFGKKLEDRLLGILAERSTMTKQAIARKWKKTDWWLSADEAAKLGFVDRVD